MQKKKSVIDVAKIYSPTVYKMLQEAKSSQRVVFKGRTVSESYHIII